MADFTAGLLAAISLLAGLVGRGEDRDAAPGVEVSLLGAALAVQAQRFVSVEPVDGAGRRASAQDRLATAGDLAAQGARMHASEELEPYYRAYRAADGFFVLTCLNEAQRRTTLRLLGLEDPFVADPQAAAGVGRPSAPRACGWCGGSRRSSSASRPRTGSAGCAPRGCPRRRCGRSTSSTRTRRRWRTGSCRTSTAPAGDDRPAARRRLQGRRRAGRRAARRARARASTPPRSCARRWAEAERGSGMQRGGGVRRGRRHRGGPHARRAGAVAARARCRTTATRRSPPRSPRWAGSTSPATRSSSRSPRLPRSSSAAGSRRSASSTRCWAGARSPATSSATAPRRRSIARERCHAIDRSEPVAYGDALGVHRVLERHAIGRGERDGARRLDRRDHRLPRRPQRVGARRRARPREGAQGVRRHARRAPPGAAAPRRRRDRRARPAPARLRLAGPRGARARRGRGRRRSPRRASRSPARPASRSSSRSSAPIAAPAPSRLWAGALIAPPR